MDVKGHHYSGACGNNDLNFSAPHEYGLWADVCGGKFLFGNKIVKETPINECNTLNTLLKLQVTWQQNVEKCCSLGMTPIIFTTEEKQRCLSDYSKSKSTQFTRSIYSTFRILII